MAGSRLAFKAALKTNADLLQAGLITEMGPILGANLGAVVFGNVGASGTAQLHIMLSPTANLQVVTANKIKGFLMNAIKVVKVGASLMATANQIIDVRGRLIAVEV